MSSIGRLLRIGAGIGVAGGAIAYHSAGPQFQFDVATAGTSLLKLADAETAHRIGMWAASKGLVPRETRLDPPSLHTRVWGRDFPNPLGLAAGFDKDAQAIPALLGLGFGHVEIGSVTPLPQPGNPQPRVFRLPELKAVINRYGFNSAGIDAVRARLAAYRERPDMGGRPPGLVGVNLGKNKTSEDAAADYCLGVSKLGPYADYLVINVSSPNTPGLRSLQGRKELQKLVQRVKSTRDSRQWGPRGPPPLLIKIAPDFTDADKEDVAAVALRQGVDGLIVSNTTISRPAGVAGHPCGDEAGGLSGAPLLEMSTEVLRDMYRLTKGRLPLIGVGGVFTGEDAYKKLRAGASLVQLYTGLAYGGPALVPRIKQELAECLRRDGFNSVSEVVGLDARAR